MAQRTWTAPKTGLMMLQRIDAERQQFINALALDAGVPEGADVEFDGRLFIECPSATICHNTGDQKEEPEGDA